MPAPARATVVADGTALPVFPKGGACRAIELPFGVWREFDPAGVDLYRLHVPVVASGRIVYTSTTDVPTLVDGAAVAPSHLAAAPPYLAGAWHEGFDRDGLAPRFFFALVGANPGDVATLIAEAAAS